MTQVTLSEAQQHLPEIISGLRPGEEVQIIQDDQAISRLVINQHHPRITGQYEGKFIVPDNFNAPLPDEILDSFLNPADLH
jgi:antitoxin (DNA-binding transcriptional repressor) of toxin-antitoxin stability system